MKPSDDLKRDIYKGKDAQTLSEIAKEVGLSECTIGRFANKLTKAGKWRLVNVLRDKKVRRAYIKVK